MARITLHKEHGVNPSLELCFWCGEAMGVALLGHNKGKEAPRHIITGYEPCQTCKDGMAQGISFVECRQAALHEEQPEIQQGLVPTGRWFVIKREAVPNILAEPMLSQVLEKGKVFVDPQAFSQIMPENLDA